MKLYTKDGCYPRPLPNALYFEDGTVRVESSTFTAQEIADSGWTEAPEWPTESFNALEQTVRWDTETSTYDIVDLSAEEIADNNSSVWNSLRTERDNLLADTDYMVIKAIEAGTTISSEWATYRQALRDLPSSVTDPRDIVWPDKPS